VILLGDGEWDGLLEWLLRTRVPAERHISADDLAVLHVVKQPAEVCEIVDTARQRQRDHGSRQKQRTTATTSIWQPKSEVRGCRWCQPPNS
jgi:predicted Rossmann-fold nucleotide-binding protein